MKKIIFLLVLQSVFIFPLYKGTVTKLKPLSPQAGYVITTQGLFKPTAINFAQNNNWWDKPNNQSSDSWWNTKGTTYSDTYAHYGQPSYNDYFGQLKYRGFKTFADKGSRVYVYMHPKFKNAKRNIEDISEDIYTTLYPEEKKQPETAKEYILDFWESNAKERARKLEDIKDFLKYKFLTAGAKMGPELYKIDMILADLAEQMLLEKRLYDQTDYTNDDIMNFKLFLWAVLFSGITGTTIGLIRDLYSLIDEYVLVKKQDLNLEKIKK